MKTRFFLIVAALLWWALGIGIADNNARLLEIRFDSGKNWDSIDLDLSRKSSCQNYFDSSEKCFYLYLNETTFQTPELGKELIGSVYNFASIKEDREFSRIVLKVFVSDQIIVKLIERENGYKVFLIAPDSGNKESSPDEFVLMKPSIIKTREVEINLGSANPADVLQKLASETGYKLKLISRFSQKPLRIKLKASGPLEAMKKLAEQLGMEVFVQKREIICRKA